MGKEITANSATAAQPDSFELTLGEFCMRTSAKDNRVELLHGFHHSERAQKRVKDTEANFAKRYEAFANAPAK